MAYVDRFTFQGPTGSAQSLGSAATIAQYLVTEQSEIEELGFSVSTATVSTGGIVLTYYMRPIYGSTSGQVSLGTVTIPTGVVAGVTYTNQIKPVVVPEGQYIAVLVTTAAAGGSAAGAGFSFVKGSLAYEQDANEANIVVVTA